MAYMSQEKKAALVPVINAVCKRHGMKATVSVRHCSTLIVTLKSGPIDFCADYVRGNRGGFDAVGNINPYWFREHYTGAALAFLSELLPAMNDGNHDRSDIQSDYFDVGWYVEVRVGTHEKPYQSTAVAEAA